MVKAIFFDIDGTLLSKKNPRIRPSLKDTLDALRNKGILLFVATGRHSTEIADLKLNEDYQFDGYITLNGCYCYNQQEVIHKAVINKNDVRNIVQLLDTIDIACLFVEEKKMYINKVNERVVKAQTAIHSPIPEVKDIRRALTNDIYQIGPYSTPDEDKMIVSVTTDCTSTRWHELGCDIISTTSGKKAGIKKVLAYYHIDKKDTMAFGDGDNDIDMLEFVNIGICMGNGTKETKEVSDFVTKDVDEDGILYGLEHFSVL